MSFKKCPICLGEGIIKTDFNVNYTNTSISPIVTTALCPTCHGHRIINDLTGFPPSSICILGMKVWTAKLIKIKQSNMEQSKITFGQEAVGISFNPGGNPAVNDIKERFAKLIDDVQNFHNTNSPDVAEAKSNPYLTNIIKGESLRTLMDAQMWAIKYITWKP